MLDTPCQGGRGRHKSRQGFPVSHHRHTCASCKKALQTCPRQLTSAKLRSARHMDWYILPTTTDAQCQPACTGLPAVPTASGRDLCTKPRAIALETTPNPNCWILDTFLQGKWPPSRKKLLFLSKLTLSGLSLGTECCLLPGPSIPGQSFVYHHASLYTQASADGGRGASRALSRRKKMSLSAAGAFPK